MEQGGHGVVAGPKEDEKAITTKNDEENREDDVNVGKDAQSTQDKPPNAKPGQVNLITFSLVRFTLRVEHIFSVKARLIRRGSALLQEALRKSVLRDQKARESEGTLKYVIKGMAKGFLVYFLPVSIIGRKPAGLRRAIVLSIFVGLVRSSDRLLRWLNRPETPKLPWDLQKKLPLHAVAGGLSALIGVTLDPSLLNSTFVFWCLVRALRLLPLPDVPHGSTIVMCLSAGQILSTWICAPQDLPAGYRKFLDRHGDTTSTVKKLIQASNKFCPHVHPGETCVQYHTRFWRQEFSRAVPLYGPLYLVFFLFGKNKNLQALQRLVISVIQSSLFLAAYCGGAYLSGCIFYRFYPHITRRSLFFCLSAAGLATLIERPSRRTELAAYCLTFALETAYRYFRVKGLLNSRPWLSAIVISLASAMMMHHHDQQPPVVIRWLFGIY